MNNTGPMLNLSLMRFQLAYHFIELKQVHAYEFYMDLSIPRLVFNVKVCQKWSDVAFGTTSFALLLAKCHTL